ncbi:hypothetical protein ABIB90_003160 [Bradyrhizobium sp. JR4.1]|uniref:hypothetical protein n=1 Tax=Bradyrhizobium sp. JR4.1 TaxID=3156372 RepID=UPI00339AEC69
MILTMSGTNKISRSTGKLVKARAFDFTARLRPVGFGAAAFSRFVFIYGFRLAKPKLASERRLVGPAGPSTRPLRAVDAQVKKASHNQLLSSLKFVQECELPSLGCFRSFSFLFAFVSCR